MAHLGTIMCSFRGKHSAHFQPITASTSVVVQRKTKKVQRVHDVLAVLWKIGKRSKSATNTQITNVLCYHNWFARSNRHVTQRMSHFLTHTFSLLFERAWPHRRDSNSCHVYRVTFRLMMSYIYCDASKLTVFDDCDISLNFDCW